MRAFTNPEQRETLNAQRTAWRHIRRLHGRAQSYPHLAVVMAILAILCTPVHAIAQGDTDIASPILLASGTTMCIAPEPCLPWMVPTGQTWYAIPRDAAERYEVRRLDLLQCRVELDEATAAAPLVAACGEHLEGCAKDLRKSERRLNRLKRQRAVLGVAVVGAAAGLVVLVVAAD